MNTNNIKNTKKSTSTNKILAKKRRSLLASFAAVLPLLSMGILVGGLTVGQFACGDDGSLGAGATINQRDHKSIDDQPYPDVKGGYWYHMKKVYNPSTAGGSQTGLTEGEIQLAGNLCIMVDSVENNFTKNSASKISGRAKVAGGFNGGDFVMNINQATAQDNATTATQDASLIDPSMVNLWLANLLPASRGHGMLSPASVNFSTRKGFTPEQQAFSKLLFFDPRFSEDLAWGGWDGYDPRAAVGASNFLKEVEDYFAAAGISGEDLKMQPRFDSLCSDAETYMDAPSCLSHGCKWGPIWDDTAATFVSACYSPEIVYYLDLAWRETSTQAPAELMGARHHVIHAEYNRNGSLAKMQEYVMNDQTDSNLPIVLAQGCNSTGACALAEIALQNATWEEAYCTF